MKKVTYVVLDPSSQLRNKWMVIIIYSIEIKEQYQIIKIRKNNSIFLVAYVLKIIFAFIGHCDIQILCSEWGEI